MSNSFSPMKRPTVPKQPEDNVGIRQMTTLLNAGYPLSGELARSIAALVCAAARAARRAYYPEENHK